MSTLLMKKQVTRCATEERGRGGDKFKDSLRIFNTNIDKRKYNGVGNKGLEQYIPVCSYLCLRRELLFWNVLSHKSHAYIPLSVFLIFFRDRQESGSVMSSSPDM